ncbi:hypothetical protein Tco_0371118 [Tanacetum coccineum]
MANGKAVALAVGFILLNLAGHCYGYYGGLQYGFYKGKCQTSDVEDIVDHCFRLVIPPTLCLPIGVVASE